MAKTLGLTWEQEEKLLVMQEKLRTLKDVLRDQLETRFGNLPEALLQRIESATDPERLKAGLRQVLTINAPEELNL